MTDIWHCKKFETPMTAQEPSSRLQEAFLNMRKISPKDSETAAIFAYHDLRSNEVTWYFSPEAAPLAKSFDATPCEKPEPFSGLVLRLGDTANWHVHFPGYVPSRR